MKKNLTELVFILDRSGSMSGLELDTIGGFNSMLAKQKKQESDVLISTVLFNQESKVIHDRAQLQEILPMTTEDYEASGCTALLDAIGGAVHHIRTVHRYIREEDVPEHTLFVITTDGMENSSHQYISGEVKGMINEQQKKGWEFLFLAANIDAVETAKAFGIHKDFSANFHNDAHGIHRSFATLGVVCSNFLSTGKVNADWKAELEKEFVERDLRSL